jgi:phosphohistidine swiveling domain-containing protein
MTKVLYPQYKPKPGIYEMSEGEFIDHELEPSKYPVWWQGQSVCKYPLGRVVSQMWWLNAVQEAAEIMKVPNAKGMDLMMTLDSWGMFYVGTRVDPSEVPAREEKFREYLMPFIRNAPKMWEEGKREFDAINKPVFDFCSHKLFNVEDYELGMWLDDVFWPAARKAHRLHHTSGMYPFAALFLLFKMKANELGWEENNSKFRKLFSGFDHLVFQVDKKLFELAMMAKHLNLQEVFKKEPSEIIPSLDQMKEGKSWLAEFRQFVDAYGWRNETFDDCSSPPWIDDPTPAIRHIKGFIGGPEKFALDLIKEKQIKEREELTADLISRAPNEKAGEEIRLLLRGAQTFQIFSEEHDLYAEQPYNAAGYRIFKEIGKRFQKGGAIDNWEDVFYLSYWEIRNRIIDYISMDFRNLVKRRKKLWAEANEEAKKRPLWLGDGTLAEPDVALALIAGLGISIEKREGAIVSGIPGSPGIVEGVARVIMGVEELDKVQFGEILIVPQTQTVWTPVFGRIKGVVADFGGILGHTAIVARDYSVPAVVSTKDGTKKIKTGQRIRVDGDNGAVYLVK